MSHNDYHVSLCSFLITSLQALKYFRLPSKILSDRPYRLFGEVTSLSNDSKCRHALWLVAEARRQHRTSSCLSLTANVPH